VARKIRILHPFHPLFGQERDLITYRQNWGEDRVYFHDEAGQLRSVPAHWTDLFPPDPFLALAAGRACFRPCELQQLVQLLAGLRSVQSAVPLKEEGPRERK
jgi:hypothetical protein